LATGRVTTKRIPGFGFATLDPNSFFFVFLPLHFSFPISWHKMENDSLTHSKARTNNRSFGYSSTLSHHTRSHLIFDLEKHQGLPLWQLAKQKPDLYGPPQSRLRKSVSNRRSTLLTLKQTNPDSYWKLYNHSLKYLEGSTSPFDKKSPATEEEEDHFEESNHNTSDHYVHHNPIPDSTMAGRATRSSSRSRPPVSLACLAFSPSTAGTPLISLEEEGSGTEYPPSEYRKHTSGKKTIAYFVLPG
jgi:hypothetical protein